MEGVDADDFSGLYDALDAIGQNYTSTCRSYFNQSGALSYFNAMRKNYIPNKVGLFIDKAQYYYPMNDAFLSLMNTGYLNRDDNLYSYSLSGDSVEARLSSVVEEEDLNLVKAGTTYQQEQFTVQDFTGTYVTSHSFTRVSQNKYQTTDDKCWKDFISVCAPTLDNRTMYMTFSKMTIETNPSENCALRIRLYASLTQRTKLADTSRNENWPNWYLLFAEATISDVGTTAFTPIEGL